MVSRFSLEIRAPGKTVIVAPAVAELTDVIARGYRVGGRGFVRRHVLD